MLTVKIAERGRKLTEHFSEDEFACRCCGLVLVHPDLPRRLEALRYVAGAPILVTSGYRCPDCNHSVGGAENSYHTFGMAADFFVTVSIAKNNGKAASLSEQVERRQTKFR